MRNISECDSSDFLCNLDEFFVLELSRIGRESCKKYLGFMLQCQFADLVEIYLTLCCCLVADEIEHFGEKCHWSAVRQMSSVREVHSENCISWLHKRRIYT